MTLTLTDLAGFDRVLDVAPAQIEHLGASLGESLSSRLALIASYTPTAVLGRSLTRLIRSLQENGYAVAVCSTSPARDRLRAHDSEPVDMEAVTVLRRPNVGYDFGSWAVLADWHRARLQVDNVLMLNDSLVGPFADLRPILDSFESSSADVWGLVESRQMIDHLQSYFRGFRFGVLAERPMREFFSSIRVVHDKAELIRAYEYEFTLFLRRYHFSVDAFVDAREIATRRQNPTIAGWRRLLHAGVPFVKQELLRRPELVPDGDQVAAELRAMFDVDVDDWT